ncbi:hypothetical protein LINPERHAP2_LOCUS34247 [Linum perenne]
MAEVPFCRTSQVPTSGNSNGKCSNRRWAGDGLLVAQVITKLTDDIGPPSRKGIVLVKTRYSKSSFV